MIKNKTFKIVLGFVSIYAIIVIINAFLTGFYGMPYFEWELIFLFLIIPLCFIALVVFASMWEQWKWKGFLPLLLLFISFFASLFASNLGRSLTSRPNNPKIFFTEQTRNDLTITAEKLLGTKYQYIRISPEKLLETREINGNSTPNILTVSNDILIPLKKYDIHTANVNHELGIVTFGYYSPRKWFEYIYCRDKLKIPASIDKKLTDHWYYNVR
jgi:hypothetical protein